MNKRYSDRYGSGDYDGRTPRYPGYESRGRSGPDPGYYRGGQERYGSDLHGGRGEYGQRGPGSREYDRDDRGDYGSGPYGSGGRDRTSNTEHDSWVGRSGFEYGFGGHGPNRYDRRSYDPYWGHDRNEERSEREDRSDRGWWDRASDAVSSWLGDEEADRRRRMDHQPGRGQFRGRGPRNYTRSDERIREDINDRLTDDHMLDASDIEVEVNNCEVVLTGTVNSRYDKRHAEDLVEEVSGVRNVENRLRVNDYAESAWGTPSNERSGGFGGTEEARSRSVGGTS